MTIDLTRDEIWFLKALHGDFGTPPSFKQLFGQASACRYG